MCVMVGGDRVVLSADGAETEETPWLIHADYEHGYWDATPDPGLGVLGAHWEEVSRSEAVRFINDMEECERLFADDWTRGALSSPRI